MVWLVAAVALAFVVVVVAEVDLLLFCFSCIGCFAVSAVVAAALLQNRNQCWLPGPCLQAAEVPRVSLGYTKPWRVIIRGLGG